MKKNLIYTLLALPCIANADLLGLSNPANIAMDKGFKAYASGNFFAGSDYIPVKQFSNNWIGPYTPKDGKNISISSGRIEAGASWDTWRLAALYRKDVLVESNRDTTNIAYDNKQNLGIPAGQTLGIDLRIQGFEADGIRLDKGFVVSGNSDRTISFGAGFSLLNGTRVRIANANGTAASTLTGYTYNATVEDANSRATYPFISNAAPIGRGYALDLGAKITWASGMRLDLAANDLLGIMRWQNMPHTIETANSATLTRNAAGYISYNPTVSGVNNINRRTITQHLEPKLHGEFSYPVSSFDFYGGTDWISGNFLPQAGIAYRMDSGWRTSVDYDVRFKSIGIVFGNKWVRLALRSDSTTLALARAYGMDAGISHSF